MKIKKIPKTEKGQQRLELIKQLINENPTITFKEIGEHLNVSKQRVHAFMKDFLPDFLERKNEIKNKTIKQIDLDKNSLSENSLIQILIMKHLLEKGKKPVFIKKNMSINNTKFYNWKKLMDKIEVKIENYNKSIKTAKKLSEEGCRDYLITKICKTQLKTLNSWRENNFKLLPTEVTDKLLKEYKVNI